MNPTHLRYSPSHEWAELKGDVCTVGITQFAVEQLTDVVFLELPKVGKNISSGEEFGVIESVKAVSPLYAPVGGEIVAVNDPLVQDPAGVSADPYGKGWMIKVKVAAGTRLDGLLSAEQYEKQIASGGH